MFYFYKWLKKKCIQLNMGSWCINVSYGVMENLQKTHSNIEDIPLSFVTLRMKIQF